MTSLLPYIKISVVSTRENCKTHEDLLKIVQDRFVRTHRVNVSWSNESDVLSIIVNYPSIEYFKKCYKTNMDNLGKLIDIVQQHNFPLSKLFTHNNKEINNPDDENLNQNYAVLKYQTNYPKPMRDSYQFMVKSVNILGAQYYIEEIDDGFLIFFGREDDFLAAQVDKSNLDEIKQWIIKKKIDIKHPAVFELMRMMDETKLKKKEP
ncbi:hypothetical protein [Candidatus Lokiarchaeum ossiferum]|uniref:hypothetical protein n=1 Tax=Candidatus Lokiarchaeum ossiferum TaxID=2951803 RepID=UPI00352C7A1B